MKSDYVVRARKFLNKFVSFFPIESGRARKDYWNVKHAVDKYMAKYDRRNVLFCHGAVRYALITSDYVIKWDYDARSAREYGGCTEESEIWNKVKNSSYAYLFAPITRIKVDGHYWYVMPRAKGTKGKGWAVRYLTSEERTFLLNNNISDLHNNNYVLKHKKPFIFDYACGW